MKDHTDAVKVVIEKLTDPAEGVIASLKEIDAVGHRIVHGGEKFKGSVVIDDSVLEAIAECNDPVSYTHLDVYKRLDEW